MTSPRARAHALFVRQGLRPRAPAAYLPGAGGAVALPRRIFRVRTAEDLGRIPFEDGMAAIELPVELIERIRFTNADRASDARQRALEASIRSRGYSPVDPVIAAIAADGSWQIIDGGHRITAVRRIAREFWANLFGRRIRTVYMLLFETRPAAACPPEGDGAAD